MREVGGGGRERWREAGRGVGREAGRGVGREAGRGVGREAWTEIKGVEGDRKGWREPGRDGG